MAYFFAQKRPAYALILFAFANRICVLMGSVIMRKNINYNLNKQPLMAYQKDI